MTPESVFVRDGERYQPTEWSVGPWASDAVQGSATAALLASLLERSCAQSLLFERRPG